MKGNVVMLYPIFITMSAFLSDCNTMVTEQATTVTDNCTDGVTTESTVSTVGQATTEEINTTDGTSKQIGGHNASTEEINTTDETPPEIGEHNATTEEINTTDETPPEIGGHNATTEEINTTDGTSKQIGGHNATIEKVNTKDGTSKQTGGHNATIEKVNTKDGTSKQIGGHTISCYVCSSNTTSEDDECYIKQGGKSSKAYCDKTCVITHYQREDSKALINVTRSCDQCINSDGGWECMVSRDVQMCTHCCDTDGCNNHIGNGYTIFMQPNFILTVSATVAGMYLAA